MNLIEKKVNSTELYKGRIINLYNDEVELPNGKHSKREYVTHNGGCAILPLTKDGDILLVRQFRYPYGEVVLEIPAGKLEKGENPDDCAVRELKEEVGGTSDNIINLGKIYPSPGYTNEILRVYLALDVEIGECNPDDDEFLQVERISLDKALDMVMQGEIIDAKSVIGILKAKRYIDNK